MGDGKIQKQDEEDECEYEEATMILTLDGKYDINLIKAAITKNDYTLRSNGAGKHVVQFGHSIFPATYELACGSDIIFPINRVDDESGSLGTPIVSDIRLHGLKTANPTMISESKG
uniref:Uncharacterized protein n=1 Tax=Rhabditophanes sp. KR3021 TaxID=114890 RepID=A0AC35UB13_9BILA